MAEMAEGSSIQKRQLDAALNAPSSRSELLELVRRLSAELSDKDNIIRLQQERINSLETRTEELKRVSLIDPLTGLGNRRMLDRILERKKSEIERESVSGHRKADAACVFFDLDNFKTVNDTYGHAKGDELLKEFANILNNQIRDVDHAVRYGGDEFIVVLLDCDRGHADSFVSRVESAVGAVKNLEVSTGISMLFADASGDVERMKAIADSRMYLKKSMRA